MVTYMVIFKCVDNFVSVLMLLRSESNENLLLIKTDHLIVSVINRDGK